MKSTSIVETGEMSFLLLLSYSNNSVVAVLTSFGYTREEINYLWLGSAANGGCYIDGKNNNVDHLGFFLMGTELKSGMIVYGGANYSSLETVIYLKRKYSAYLMQVYFPAALIVILSWTIFWINLHATPARASLGVTTVLTMLTLGESQAAAVCWYCLFVIHCNLLLLR